MLARHYANRAEIEGEVVELKGEVVELKCKKVAG